MIRFQDDPSLVRERLHAQWVIERMRGLDAGELANIVKLTITERWVVYKKASYAYELAWIFQRDRGTIGNALRNLEGRGEIERVDPNPKHRRTRTFYKPVDELAKGYAASLLSSHDDPDEPDGWYGEWMRNLHSDCPCNCIPVESS